jgi:hypothetical protein
VGEARPRRGGRVGRERGPGAPRLIGSRTVPRRSVPAPRRGGHERGPQSRGATPPGALAEDWDRTPYPRVGASAGCGLVTPPGRFGNAQGPGLSRQWTSSTRVRRGDAWWLRNARLHRGAEGVDCSRRTPASRFASLGPDPRSPRLDRRVPPVGADMEFASQCHRPGRIAQSRGKDRFDLATTPERGMTRERLEQPTDQEGGERTCSVSRSRSQGSSF